MILYVFHKSDRPGSKTIHEYSTDTQPELRDCVWYQVDPISSGLSVLGFPQMNLTCWRKAQAPRDPSEPIKI